MTREKISVVVNFLSQVIFVFLLFFGMVMHANEVETKGKKMTSDQKLTKTACVTDETKLTAVEAALLTLVHPLAQI